MASTFSTDLALELVATGEKAGLWGTITNTNLQVLQQSQKEEIRRFERAGCIIEATEMFRSKGKLRSPQGISRAAVF